MNRMRIGLIKEPAIPWQVDDNFRNVERLVRLHSRDGVDLFVTPECFLDGYAASQPDWTAERFASIALSIDDSPYIEALRRTAAVHHTHILCGFTERIGERFYNCALLVGRGGEILGKYHKTHLLDHDLRFSPGQDLPVFDLDIGRVGILIGADRCWPETMRTLRVKGAQVCLLPSFGMSHLENEWWTRTRACENEMYVCVAHPQGVFVADPAGQIVARMQSGVEDVLIHNLDLEQVTDAMLRARRPDLYRPLAT